MPGPTASDVHVSVPLTNISIAYMQDASNFVATAVFPNIPVQKQADRYWTYDRGEFNRDEMQKRAPGTESAGGSYNLDNTPSYFCDVWSLHKDIPDQVRSNEDTPLNSDRDATNWLSLKGLIRREKLFMSSYMTSGLWTTDLAGVSGVPSTGQFRQWSDYDNSTPIKDIRGQMTAMQSSTGLRPNKIIFAQDVWDILTDHPDFLDRIKYGQTAGSPAKVTKEAFAALLEIDQVIIAAGVENTAKEGLAATNQFICSKKALLVYATPTPGLMVPTAGYTFSWTGYLNAGNQGNRMSKFRMEHLKSDRVEIEMAFTQKLVAADLGTYFGSVIA